MAQRKPQRPALVEGVRSELTLAGTLPADAAQARSLIEAKVKNSVRQSGRSNVSRAVSELVRAGLLTRHYQGYSVDHQNRGVNVRPSTRLRPRHARRSARQRSYDAQRISGSADQRNLDADRVSDGFPCLVGGPGRQLLSFGESQAEPIAKR